MEKLVGMRWGDLSQDTRNDLLEKATIWDNVKEGPCIYDLTETLSIAGSVICINDAEGYFEYVIENDAIIYEPSENSCPDMKLDVVFEINEIMTVSEAAENWNLTEGAIRASIKTGKFILGVDYRKAGRITLITKEAMIRVYGEPK